jgi:hypothetical protein
MVTKNRLVNRLFAGKGILYFVLVFCLFALSVQQLVPVLKPEVAKAATNSTINFQARLLTSSGNTVPDGNYHVEFKLHDDLSAGGGAQGACSGSCLWRETRTTGNLVRVVNGYMTVNLGSVTAFGGGIEWDQEHWLSLNIGGNGGGASWDGEMSPRLKFTATPYAFEAGQLTKQSGGNRATLAFDTLTGNRSILLPDESGTVCLQSSSNCGFAVGTAGDYIQNGTSPQTADFNITGDGTIGDDLTVGGDALFSDTSQIVFDGDTNLYRDSANVLKTDDSLVVQGTLSAANDQFTVNSSGGAEATALQVTNTVATLGLTGTGDSENFSLINLYSDEATDKTWQIAHRQMAGSLNDLMFFYHNGTDWINPFTLSNIGEALFQAGTDSATALEVKDAAGDQRFVIDTLDGSGALFNFYGAINQETTTGADFTIDTDSSATNAFAVHSGFGNNLLNIHSDTGRAYFKNTDDSTTAFQVQNAGGAEILTIDTSNSEVEVEGTLIVNDDVYIDSNISVFTSSESNVVFNTLTHSDGFDRFRIYGDGELEWGPGNATRDTNLYRSAADTLETDGFFYAGEEIRAAEGQTARVRIGGLGPSGEAAIIFGSGDDTNLYRSASNTLKTQDTFDAADYSVNGTAGSSVTCSGGEFLQNQVVSGGIVTGGTCAAGAGGAADLQDAYDGGNTLTTTDGRDIDITLANTTTDANLTIDIATGSTGELKVQSNGTDVLQIGAAGQLQLDVQGSSGGILFGGDANLYRYDENVLALGDGDGLRIDNGQGDMLKIHGDDVNGVWIEADNPSTNSWLLRSTADTSEFSLNGDGAMSWDDGSSEVDLYHNGGGTLQIDSDNEEALVINQMNGVDDQAYLQLQVNGVDQWEIGSEDDGMFFLYDDTNSEYRMRIFNDGNMDYDGDIFATELIASTQIYADGYITASDDITDGEVKLGGIGPSSKAAILFGTDSDTNLYRDAANTLKTDDNFIVSDGTDDIVTINPDATGYVAAEPSLEINTTGVEFPTLSIGNTDESAGGVLNLKSADGEFNLIQVGTSLVFHDGTATRAQLQTNGQFSVGGTGPAGGALITSTQADNPPLALNRTITDGVLIDFLQEGVIEGTVTVSGTTVSYNAFTGSHYARTTESIDPGMLVSLTGDNSRLGDREESEVIYGVKKTTQANDPGVLGSYLAVQEPKKEDGSDNPESNTNPSLINAVGNSEIWIVDNGQDINPGDGLMSSDTAGYAMKDPGTYETSYIIAKAAEKVDWDGVTETIDGKKVKKVSVLYGAYEGGDGQPKSGVSSGDNLDPIILVLTSVGVQSLLIGAGIAIYRRFM